MDNIVRRTWNQRRFVALGAMFSGLAMPVTGLADHLAGNASDPGAVVGWSIVHVVLGVMFVTFVAWHAVVNRLALVAYLRARAPRRHLPGREALAAFALVAGVLALTMAHAIAGP